MIFYLILFCRCLVCILFFALGTVFPHGADLSPIYNVKIDKGFLIYGSGMNIGIICEMLKVSKIIHISIQSFLSGDTPNHMSFLKYHQNTKFDCDINYLIFLIIWNIWNCDQKFQYNATYRHSHYNIKLYYNIKYFKFIYLISFNSVNFEVSSNSATICNTSNLQVIQISL